jgi:hypothetical protein
VLPCSGVPLLAVHVARSHLRQIGEEQGQRWDAYLAALDKQGLSRDPRPPQGAPKGTPAGSPKRA